MKTKSQFKKVIYTSFLVIIATLTFNTNLSAQSATDFWDCFENITTIENFKNNYPVVAEGTVQNHILMDHGIEIPSNSDYQFQTNITVNTLDKNGIFAQNATEFFIIREAKFDGNSAIFELMYYYNFSGNYEHSKTGKVTLVKTNDNWSITNSIVE